MKIMAKKTSQKSNQRYYITLIWIFHEIELVSSAHKDRKDGKYIH